MKRAILKHMALLAAAMLIAPLAAAQANYPDRPIRMIVAFPPGGVVDPAARVVAQKMSELLGQPIIIDNRAGGNTSIGAGMVAKAPPDGYTLLFTAGSTHVIHTLPLFSQFGLGDLEKIESVNVILAPVATPEPIIAKLSAAVKKALEAPEVRTGIENLKMQPFFLPPAELGERMRNERARYVEVIEKANIQLTP